MLEDKMMDDFDVKPILESLFFISDSPIRLETLVEILPESNKEAILEGIRQIQAEYEDRSKGVELTEIAGGYQFRTKPSWAGWVNRLKKAKAVKLSQAALETLAIVAYRQPVIRPAIEEIRGVDSGSVVHTLLEKGLIKMMGRKDLPGRPIVYGTTKAFLELFSLNTLSDLPSLKEIQPPPAPEELSPKEIFREEILKTETEGITPHQNLPLDKGEG
jgi:segregation and condensation protein B